MSEKIIMPKTRPKQILLTIQNGNVVGDTCDGFTEFDLKAVISYFEQFLEKLPHA